MKHGKTYQIFPAICAAGFLSILVIAEPANADGLLEVEQTVFGMDCAPCAYGVEKSLLGLPGVEKVNVSLNLGKVSLTLAPQNPVTIQQIRRRIRNNGFTPREAHVRALGKLVHRDNQVELVLGPGSVLRLIPGTQADLDWDEIRRLEPGNIVEIAGQIATESGEPPQVSVITLILRSNRDASG
ncbi:MAG: heavy metal-associated domain-containing protein [Burkholderiales bacterium]